MLQYSRRRIQPYTRIVNSFMDKNSSHINFDCGIAPALVTLLCLAQVPCMTAEKPGWPRHLSRLIKEKSHDVL